MRKNSFAQIQRGERLSTKVASQIENLILSDILKTGERLPPERELCEQFGVSRTVVREAIRVLEAKGLLISRSGSGTYVRSLESGDVADSLGMFLTTQSHSVSHEDLIEVRRVLEVRIAALAAERATKESLDELEEILSGMELVLNDPSAFAQYDLEFHVALARTTGNEVFALILDPFLDVLYEARRLASKLEGVPEEALAFHRSIFEKVKSGNPEEAAEVMTLHLEQAYRVTKMAISSNS